MAERKTTKKTSEDAEPRTMTAAADADTGSASGESTKDGETQTSDAVKPTGVSGPGTGAAAPADEQQRTPEGTVVATDAGPLVPTDIQKTREPRRGHLDSSTDDVAANAARRTIAGSSHVKIVDEQDNEVGVDDIFSTKDPSDPSVYVLTRQRVYQVFTYPGTKTPTRQLLYPEGARVTVFEAERVKAALRDGVQDSAESMRPAPQGQRTENQG